MRLSSGFVICAVTLALICSLASAKVKWGALIGSQFTGREAPADWNAVTKFEQKNAGGKKVTAIHHGGNWYAGAGCGGYCRFDSVGLGNIVSHGALPVYSWGSTTDKASDQAKFYNKAIAAGSQDTYIRQWAQDAKAFGRKLVLAPNWEMNGNWYPWSPQKSGPNGSAKDYVNAWRRMYKIIKKEVGAKNVLFAWAPNIDPDGWWAKQSGYSLKEMYPGNKYVDLVAMDGYNGANPWTSFKNLFYPTYKQLKQIARGKPAFILEVGCTEKGGNKAQWISDMFKDLSSSMSGIKMLLWYNRRSPGPGGNSDWSIETSKKSTSAFKKGIKSSRY